MRLLLSPLHLGCQLAALAVGVTAIMNSGISEIDLIIPTPNTTYEIAANGRFAVVWAVRNPSLWRGQTVEMLYSITSLDAPPVTVEAYDNHVWDLRSTQEDTHYISAEVHLVPDKQYRVMWQVYGDQCKSLRGFENGTDSKESDSPATDGWKFIFNTKPGGEKADFSSAIEANCSKRTAVAYNIQTAVASLGCRIFDDVDPFPSPKPCELKMLDSDIANVTHSLDDQFKKICPKYLNVSDCPGFEKKKEEKSIAARIQIGAGALLLGLPLVALFL